MKTTRPTPQTQYWIVIRLRSAPSGRIKGAQWMKPPYRHATMQAACREAERLAKEFPNCRFEVFKWKLGVVQGRIEPKPAASKIASPLEGHDENKEK